MGLIFYLLLVVLNEQLAYLEILKFVYLLFAIFVSLISYIIISFFTKAFKLDDIKLDYK